MAREVTRELGRQSGGRWSRWQERLASFSVEVSVAGIVKIGARANEKDQSSADRDALVGLLEDSATLAREKDRPGLLLTVDELQEGSSTDLSVWANTVQDDGDWRCRTSGRRRRGAASHARAIDGGGDVLGAVQL